MNDPSPSVDRAACDDDRAGTANPAVGPARTAEAGPGPLVLVTVASTDEQLVHACLDGDQRAWTLLITRYKPLILSFPRRYGARAQDAADIFQFVCTELFLALPRLRKPESLRSWLMTVAAHEAHHWKRRQMHRLQGETADAARSDTQRVPSHAQLLEYAERDQRVRDAIAQLPARSRALVQLLFFEDPPTPYAEVAQRLGLSNGSVPAIRDRCLKRLRRLLVTEVPTPPARPRRKR